MLADTIENEKIKIMSYDSLVSRYSNYVGVDCEKVILSPWREQGFKVKSLPKEKIDTSLFTYVSPEYLKVNAGQVESLKAQGYEMDEWLDGFALAYNNKYATDVLIKEKYRF